MGHLDQLCVRRGVRRVVDRPASDRRSSPAEFLDRVPAALDGLVSAAAPAARLYALATAGSLVVFLARGVVQTALFRRTQPAGSRSARIAMGYPLLPTGAEVCVLGRYARSVRQLAHNRNKPDRLSESPRGGSPRFGFRQRHEEATRRRVRERLLGSGRDDPLVARLIATSARIVAGSNGSRTGAPAHSAPSGKVTSIRFA